MGALATAFSPSTVSLGSTRLAPAAGRAVSPNTILSAIVANFTREADNACAAKDIRIHSRLHDTFCT